MLTDWERIQKLLKHFRLSKNGLGVSIGDKNGMRFTYVQQGRNNISEKLATDITKVYPEISKYWLMTGEGEMLVEDIKNNKSTTFSDESVVDYIIEHSDRLLKESPKFKMWFETIWWKAKYEALKEGA